jgi:CRP-like cAMP-binding protein
VLVCEDLTRELGLHPIQSGRKATTPIHTKFRLSEMRSKRWRSPEQAEFLQREGGRAGAFELQGDLDFSASELAIRAILSANLDFTAIDLHLVNEIDNESADLFADLCAAIEEDGRGVVLCGAHRFVDRLSAAAGRELPHRGGLDLALEWCEDQLLGDPEAAPEPDATELRDHSLLVGLSEEHFERVKGLMERRELSAGESLFQEGDPANELYLLTRGRISAFVELRSGDSRRVSTVGPGGLMGEIAFVMSTPRSASVTVDSDIECWCLPHTAIKHLRDEDPVLQATILANLLGIFAEDAKSFERAVHALSG